MAADDAASAAAPKEAEAGASSSPPPPKKQRPGFFSRMWRAIFGRGDEDYEKRLQYLSKEEATLYARMKRRAQTSRRTVRHLIIFSILTSVAATIYAIITTRTPDLDWRMRATRVLPMFVLPAFSFILYSALVRFTRMLDQKDQKTLEKLRAERKEKIDELKERTNYYATQQLIQKYDLDPAAKAAAATVLATKLGAETGLKLVIGDEAKKSASHAQGIDADPTRTTGLRNRRHPHASGSTTAGTIISQPCSEISDGPGADGEETAAESQRVVEHFKGAYTATDGWIARLAAMLVGEEPSQCYALICGNCRMHNGLARKEDYPHISYYCPHCHVLNASLQSGERESGSSSGRGISFPPVDADAARGNSVPPVEVDATRSEVAAVDAEVSEQAVGQNDQTAAGEG